MIVSYKHNYIFIKTNKTAGTSMEIALSTHTGEEDIITPIEPIDELKRLENSKARLPQNFCAEKAIEYAYREVIKSGNEEYVTRFQKKALRSLYTFRNHMSARKIRKKLDPRFFQNAFKFTIERHPYDRMISFAYWTRKNPQREIGEVIDEILDDHSLTNTDFYMIDGNVMADYFVRFEAMHEGIDAVGEKIGAADLWSEFPQTKHTHRTDRRPAAEVLTNRQKKRIARQCKTEFEMFGYEP
ncbi:MAG: sulfotransferase family 2 domain-containing protein [Rhizomicrobium sp.]